MLIAILRSPIQNLFQYWKSTVLSKSLVSLIRKQGVQVTCDSNDKRLANILVANTKNKKRSVLQESSKSPIKLTKMAKKEIELVLETNDISYAKKDVKVLNDDVVVGMHPNVVPNNFQNYRPKL